MKRKNKSNKRKKRRNNNVSFEKLEPRNLMATFSVAGNPGVQTFDIRGTSQADVISITQSGGNVTAQVGSQARTIPRNSFNSIRVFGFGGNDRITNNTTIPSRVAAGFGNDVINGGFGNDTLFGQEGNDTINGRGGNDTIDGFSGNDVIRGGGGNDRLYGGFGADRIFGNQGIDRLLGSFGNDVLDPGAGGVNGNAEFVNGGDEDDFLVGGTGSNIFVGGRGDDQYLINSSTGGVGGFDSINERPNEGQDRVLSDLNINPNPGINGGRIILNHGNGRHISISSFVEDYPHMRVSRPSPTTPAPGPTAPAPLPNFPVPDRTPGKPSGPAVDPRQPIPFDGPNPFPAPGPTTGPTTPRPAPVPAPIPNRVNFNLAPTAPVLRNRPTTTTSIPSFTAAGRFIDVTFTPRATDQIGGNGIITVTLDGGGSRNFRPTVIRTPNSNEITFRYDFGFFVGKARNANRANPYTYRFNSGAFTLTDTAASGGQAVTVTNNLRTGRFNRTLT
jgi:Ca2+-binding RTX toxin-like protein